jgi:MoaA/NifB/PqqE/SkfB family radical SAM enzyme
LVGKLRQPAIQDSVQRIRSGDRLQAPVIVELDPTSFCDLACPECISSDLLSRLRFTSEQLERLSRNIVDMGVRGVILIGGGEPLLHPAIERVISTMSAGGVRVGLTTNGTQIDRHLDTIAEHMAWTRVSVDAATPGTYEAFRPARNARNQFSHVVENMSKLASTKTGMLGFSFLVMARVTSEGEVLQTNAHEIAAAARLAKNIGCDYFEVKPEYDSQHYLLSRGSRLAKEISEQELLLHDLADGHWPVLVHPNLHACEQAGGREQPKSYSRCYVADMRTLITPGGAYLCPYFRGREFARYGDPKVESLWDLWNGPRRDEVGRDVDPGSACRFHCIRHESNLRIMGPEAERINGQEGSLDDYDPFI